MIAFGSVGAVATGTGSAAPAYPSGIAAGDMLVLCVVNKYPANGPSTPAGWSLQTQASGGAGASGANAGSVYATFFTKQATGSESGTLTVTVTSGNVVCAVIARYTKNAGSTWIVTPGGTGAKSTAGTAWSIALTGLPVVNSSDLVLSLAGVNSNLYTATAEALSNFTGISTWSAANERVDGGATAGDNCHMVLCDHAPTDGPSTVSTGTYTATMSGTSGSTPAGCVAMLRLREAQIKGAYIGHTVDSQYTAHGKFHGRTGTKHTNTTNDWRSSLGRFHGHPGAWFQLTTLLMDEVAPGFILSSPAAGSNIGADTPLIFSLTDVDINSPLQTYQISIEYPTLNRTEFIQKSQDGAVFQYGYRTYSIRTTVPYGFLFSIRRDTGWIDSTIILTVTATDTVGDVMVPAVTTWYVPTPAPSGSLLVIEVD